MATKAQPVRMGPFTGGLNTYSDASAIADEEVQDLINFDVDLDGSLVSRPAIVAGEYNNDGNGGQRILGVYVAVNGDTFLIVARMNGTGAFNVATGAWITIDASLKGTAMVQYMNKAWIIADPTSVGNGGSWDGTTFTAVATQPKGCTATIYKERIFIGTGKKDTTNPSRLFFSGPANPTSWTGTDFLDVNNGDGQDLIKIHSFSGSVVVFKTNSTYIYAYESSPTKGQTQNISATIGIDDVDCMAENENILYVMSGNDAYSISNWNWEQINVKVPFKFVNAHVGTTRFNLSVSAVENRIIFRYFDTYYVYGTKTRAWTKWTTTLTPSAFIKSPLKNAGDDSETYYAGNYLQGSLTLASPGNRIFTFKSNHEGARTEAFTCSVTTKVFSMNVPYSFKRLMWWGVDALIKSKLDVIITPITYGLPVRWLDLAPRTWADMATHTWGAPLEFSLNVTDTADIKNTDGVRMFIKYIKSLRFRQIQFTLSSAVDGSTVTGPLRIYSLTAFIINKETVVKKIS